MFTMFRYKQVLSLLTGLLMITGATGCATNSHLAKVESEAREARRTADHALTIAQEANNRSMRTEEMVDRSFRHSLRK